MKALAVALCLFLPPLPGAADTTYKETALHVFINMNTNSKPLSLYDIIVAEVESVRGRSLHELQQDLEEQLPAIESFDVSRLILTTAALLQDKLPNERGMIDMDKSKLIDHWERIIRALRLACEAHFADGNPISPENRGRREYHHIYPDALLEEAKVASFLALNCALITGKTNRTVGRKDPLVYLQDRYHWASPEIVHERLRSHGIPVAELANGGYEGLDDDSRSAKIRADFQAFIQRRAELMLLAMHRLANGQDLCPTDLTASVDTEESQELS